MNEKKPEAIQVITPFGTLRYPNVSRPDTRGAYADGKFKTDIVFSDDDFAILEKAIMEAAAKLLPAAKNLRLPLFTEWEGGQRHPSQMRVQACCVRCEEQEAT